MSEEQLNPGSDATTTTTASAAAVTTVDPWYRALFLENHQPAWMFDPETLAFLSVNDAAVRRYGYSQEQFLSMTLKSIRPPEDVPALLDSVASLDRGKRFSGEWRHLTRDGSLLYVEIASYDFNLEGRRARLAVINDVTERHRAEEALRQTISDYRGLFENAHDAILIIAADDETVLDVNQRACEMYGYPRASSWGCRCATSRRTPPTATSTARRP